MNQITELALKLMALGCFIYALSHAGYSLSFLFVPNAQFAATFKTLAFIAPIIGPVISGLLLFSFAKKLSTHLIPSQEASNEINLQIEPKELHSILLSIFGFVLVAITVLPLFNIFSAYLIREIRHDMLTDVSTSDAFSSYGFLFGYSCQLLLGIWFAFGAKGISGFIYKLRYSRR